MKIIKNLKNQAESKNQSPKKRPGIIIREANVEKISTLGNVIIEYYQGLWKTLFFHWLVDEE